MPVVPSCLLEPVWAQFAYLLPDRPEFDPNHPVGCHRRRIADRVVFEHVIAALVHGSGYERIASKGCSDRTIRRRLAEWAAAGIAQQIHRLALVAYDKIIGLDLDNMLIDGCHTKAPCGGDKAGPSPVDRRKGGLKRSTATDAHGIPLAIVTASGNRHDFALFQTTLDAAITNTGPIPAGATVHLDAGYDYLATPHILAHHGLNGRITRQGHKPPIKNTPRWAIERTNAWGNNYGKLRRLTDRNSDIVDFYTHLAATLTTIRRLIQQARTSHRWPHRPTTRRLT